MFYGFRQSRGVVVGIRTNPEIRSLDNYSLPRAGSVYFKILRARRHILDFTLKRFCVPRGRIEPCKIPLVEF